jgi:predicted permease
MRSFWQDFKYGLRGFRNQPLFTTLALLALGLGIGAATTIFSVIQNVLLDPFPYAGGNRVVQFYIHDTTNGRPGGRSSFLVEEFLNYKDQTTVFEDVIGGTSEDALITTAEGTEQYQAGLVTENTFRFLGVPALLGRTLTAEDGRPGASPVFVMNHKMWTKYYNKNPKILGRVFVINGVPTTLVGIMPFRFNKLGADLYRPAHLDPADPEWNQRYFLFQGKLKPGATLQQAQAELNLIAHRLATAYPKKYPKNFTVVAQKWIDGVVGPFKQTLFTLAAAVGLLLLIACANVANLLLARASARAREMAVRAAVGANRSRLIKQLLIESLALAFGGMLVGILFSVLGMRAFTSAIPDGLIPREAQIQMNIPVLLFSIALAAVTTLIFGLMPALQTAKEDPLEPLKDSGKGAGTGFRQGRLRSALVVSEVALSLLLLAGAGLMMRSFFKLIYKDLGFEVDHVLAARLPLPRGQYKTAQAKQNFFRALLPKVQALPGVVAVTETSTLPPYGGIRSEIQIPGKTHSEAWDAIFQLCSEGYFPTLGLRLVRGRVFSEAEVSDARKVAVVNQTLVNKYFGREDPIGKTVKFELLETIPDNKVDNPVFEIVGVVGDALNQGIDQPPTAEAFLPYTITGAFERGILVRTAGDPALLLNNLRSEIWSVDRNVGLTLTGSLKEWVKQFSYAEPRLEMILFGVFGGVGLTLVAIGVYSVLAYSVARQTREMGIRMALGATRWNVLGMVMMRGSVLIGIGIVLGLLASLAATRVLASMLRDVSARDPLTLIAVVLLLAITGLAACYFPALRATRVEPTTALRYE